MSFPDPALITGLVLVAAAGLLGGLSIARRRPPEVHLTITRNALPPRDPAAPLDRTDPVAVRVGEPAPAPTAVPVGLPVASGVDPVLYRLLAVDTRGEVAASELAPPGHEDRGAASRPPAAGPVEWRQAGVVGRSGVPIFARAELASAGDPAAVSLDGTAPAPSGRSGSPGPAKTEGGTAVESGGASGGSGNGATYRMESSDGIGDVAAGGSSDTDAAGPGAAAAEGSMPDGGAPAAASFIDTEGVGPQAGGGGNPTDDVPGAPPDGEAACAAERHLVQELSALVVRARAVHDDELDRQRRLQRDHDTSSARAQAAAHVMDGRRVLEEKEAAQRRFRAERVSARDATAVEEAAARWLASINQLNVRVRDAQLVLAAERRRAGRLLAEIESGAGRVDAARVALEAAEHKANQAREALAACEELHGARLAAAAMASGATRAAEAAQGPVDAAPGEGVAAPEQGAIPGPSTVGLPPVPVASAPAAAQATLRPAATSRAGPDGGDDLLEHTVVPPRSLLARILEGDDDALARAVADLAPDSVDDGRRWHLELSALRDSLTQAAIEAAHVDLPADHPFWSEFSQSEAREIAVVLSSLGYRYDGRGGFADDRAPSTRDLALAVGYAGVDPRRIRRWPAPAEIPLLLAGARVAVAEFVLAGAPQLLLGQMVGLLGRRAPELTSLWDEWGRVRPILASTPD